MFSSKPFLKYRRVSRNFRAAKLCSLRSSNGTLKLGMRHEICVIHAPLLSFYIMAALYYLQSHARRLEALKVAGKLS